MEQAESKSGLEKSLFVSNRCVEKNKEVVKYYNVRFITESHPWPQVLKSSLFQNHIFWYRNYLSINVSKLGRTAFDLEHEGVFQSSNPVNETDRANILIMKDLKKTWSQTLEFDSYCPEADRHSNFTDIWFFEIFIFHTFQKIIRIHQNCEFLEILKNYGKVKDRQPLMKLSINYFMLKLSNTVCPNI